jgi:methionyl-tRNA synthetase
MLGAPAADAAPLLARAAARLAEVPGLYREFESSKALRLAIEIAEDFNQFVTESAPWKLATSDPERARAICSAAIHAGKIIAAILKPVLPAWAEKTERMLLLPAPLTFANGAEPLPADHMIGAYETLAERIDPASLAAIVEASKESLGGSAAEVVAEAPAYTVEDLTAEASIDGFKGVDLRVGKVVTCARVKGSDKLLQLSVDLGPLGTRNIFSGIALSYAPEQLIGKHVVVFANLKPRKMRFGVSEGMILAAGASDDAVTVLELDGRSRPGERIS